MVYFLLYPLFFTVFRVLLKVLGRVRSSGEENVPSRGPIIYCPNHLSDADPPTLFACVSRRAWYLGKKELFAAPGVGWLFAQFRGIPITRDSADRAALRRAEEVLKRGEALVVFPEGRCSQTGQLQRIQPGAALLAMRTGAAIIPVGIQNTNEVLPYGAAFPRFARHAVRVDFGRPLYPQQFSGLSRSKAIEALTKHVGIELARLTSQPLPPEAPVTSRKNRSPSGRFENDHKLA